MTDVASSSGRATRRDWIALGLLTGPILLVSMDGSILFLTMPRISEALAPTAPQQLWILDIYAFLVAGLLILMGNLGDRHGRRRLMWLGAAVFGIGSVAAAFATSPEMLIVARALMGVGGSTLLPSSLAIIGTVFTDPRQRSTAIGIWAAWFGAGFAIGPLIGAALLNHFWWGSVFLVNLPVVIFFLVLAPLVLREARTEESAPLDLLSAALSFAGILMVVYALKAIAADGPTAVAVVVGMLGAVLLAVFLSRQFRLPAPLVQVQLFRRPLFTMAIVAAGSSVFSFAAATYLGAVYLQTVLGMGIVAAGMMAIPAAITTFALSTGSGALVERVGSRGVLSAAFAFMGTGLLVLAAAPTFGGLVTYGIGTAVSGIGYGLVFAVASEIAVTAVPERNAGSASAISETSFELGQALGLAILGSLAALIFRLAGPGVADTLSETVRLAGDDAVIAEAQRAFTLGFGTAVIVGGLMHLALAVVAAVVLRRR